MKPLINQMSSVIRSDSPLAHLAGSFKSDVRRRC
jgi:hypothetical protein